MSSVLRSGASVPVRARVNAPLVFQDFEEEPGSKPSLSQDDAFQAVADAREEAEQIVRAAREQAAGLRTEAEYEARQVYSESRDEGYAEGQATARQEAEVAVRADVAQAAIALRADVEVFCEAVLDEQERVWRGVETQLQGFALEIAARVVKEEMTINPEVVMQITRHALRRLVDKEHVRIQVHPDDVEHLRGRRDELLATFEGLRSVEITEDRRVSIGGVRVETDSGTLDARIETQLGEIARVLDAS